MRNRQVQRLELAPTLVPLPQESAADVDEAEAEPMPQRQVVLAGFPLDPGATLASLFRS